MYRYNTHWSEQICNCPRLSAKIRVFFIDYFSYHFSSICYLISMRTVTFCGILARKHSRKHASQVPLKTHVDTSRYDMRLRKNPASRYEINSPKMSTNCSRSFNVSQRFGEIPKSPPNSPTTFSHV